MCTHGKQCGVNFYSRLGDFGFWSHGDASENWIALECVVAAGKALEGGSKGRFCIASTENLNFDWATNQLPEGRASKLCPYIGVRAIWIRERLVPAELRGPPRQLTEDGEIENDITKKIAC